MTGKINEAIASIQAAREDWLRKYGLDYMTDKFGFQSALSVYELALV
jgi:hypothetical protein